MESKSRIYIDLDDVLCDTAGAYLQLVEKEFGLQKRFEDILSFNLQESFDLTDKENKHMFERAHRSEFTLNLEIFDGVWATLKAWHDQGYQIDIVTGRHTSAHKDTILWLEEHRVPFDTFTMVDKYRWEGTDNDIAVSLGEIKKRSFCYGIEDNLNMTTFLAKEMSLPVLLHDRPWNRNTRFGDGVTRFSEWPTLLEIVQAENSSWGS